jgi:hypothetical protein
MRYDLFEIGSVFIDWYMLPLSRESRVIGSKKYGTEKVVGLFWQSLENFLADESRVVATKASIENVGAIRISIGQHRCPTCSTIHPISLLCQRVANEQN